jgi:hypothetical protein
MCYNVVNTYQSSPVLIFKTGRGRNHKVMMRSVQNGTEELKSFYEQMAKKGFGKPYWVRLEQPFPPAAMGAFDEKGMLVK